jgi:peptidoglycan/LPS O-acetylase OafA/YrhL
MSSSNKFSKGTQFDSRAFPALDGLRGIAAILVALFHFRSSYMSYNGYPAGDGYLAVDLFFMLSGFVLSHAYAARFERGTSALEFMKIRLIRLYPLYFVGLAFGAVTLLCGIGKSENIATTGQVGSAWLLEVAMLPV